MNHACKLSFRRRPESSLIESKSAHPWTPDQVRGDMEADGGGKPRSKIFYLEDKPNSKSPVDCPTPCQPARCPTRPQIRNAFCHPKRSHVNTGDMTPQISGKPKSGTPFLRKRTQFASAETHRQDPSSGLRPPSPDVRRDFICSLYLTGERLTPPSRRTAETNSSPTGRGCHGVTGEGVHQNPTRWVGYKAGVSTARLRLTYKKTSTSSAARSDSSSREAVWRLS
jgi:hypothetical protein